jgi:hypothetical protein
MFVGLMNERLEFHEGLQFFFFKLSSWPSDCIHPLTSLACIYQHLLRTSFSTEPWIRNSERTRHGSVFIPVAAVTNDHKPNGLKQHKFIIL